MSSLHSSLTGNDLHEAFHFVSAVDPGAVGAGLYWLDTSQSTYLLKRRNGTNTAWVSIGAGESAPASPFVWDENTTTLGVDTDRFTGSAYARQTAEILLFRPVKMHSFFIDIRVNGTYSLFFGGRKDLIGKSVCTSVVVSNAPAEITFTPDGGDFIMTPGFYDLTLKISSGTCVFAENSSSGFANALFVHDKLYYNSNGFDTSMPLKIEGYLGDWAS